VSLLKKNIGEQIPDHTNLPQVADDGELLLEPEPILDTRWIKRDLNLLKKA
jgi:hypothetical protein